MPLAPVAIRAIGADRQHRRMGSGDDESRPFGDDAPSDGSTAVSDAVPDALGRRGLAVVGVAVVLLAAVALGMGAVGGGTDAGSVSTATPAPTATPPPTASDATTTAERAPAITMRVRSVDSCGSRCREVTVALSNEGGAAANDVRVVTTVSADGSLVWEGRSEVGHLASGETVTRTRTIEVDYLDAVNIKANDGVVRIETTVRTASGTQTFTERRDVA
jgi:hypothetical protein